MPNEKKALAYMMQAIKRLGTPADIAGPVAFLTSDDARFVTGQTIAVGGGLMKFQGEITYAPLLLRRFVFAAHIILEKG